MCVSYGIYKKNATLSFLALLDRSRCGSHFANNTKGLRIIIVFAPSEQKVSFPYILHRNPLALINCDTLPVLTPSTSSRNRPWRTARVWARPFRQPYGG